MQRLEGTFLRAPKQCHGCVTVGSHLTVNERLLFGGEVIGHECAAMRFNQLQITTQINTSLRQRTKRATVPVTQGNRDIRRIIFDEDLRSAGCCATNLDLRQIQMELW